MFYGTVFSSDSRGSLILPPQQTSAAVSVRIFLEGFSGSLILPPQQTSAAVSVRTFLEGFSGSLILPPQQTSAAVSVRTFLEGFSVLTTGWEAFSGDHTLDSWRFWGRRRRERRDLPNSQVP